MITTEQWIQGIVAILVIVAPPDPVKVLVFNDVVRRDGLNRAVAAGRVALYFAVIMCVFAFVGKELLELLGINLSAFKVVGGLIIAGMGFEMLYGGVPSKAQGQDVREQEEEDGPSDGDGLLLPLTTPLLAGPGAIATVVTISTFSDSGEATLVAFAGVAVTAVAIFASLAWMGGAIAKLSDRATTLLARIGGLVLATLGTQMLLGGLKEFFEAT